MKRFSRALLLALSIVAGGFAASAQAEDMVAMATIVGDLEITGAFSRATLPNAPTAGGYLTIANNGAEDDMLVSAESPMAGLVELHQMKMDGDVMMMSPVEAGVEIPAGGTVTLAPGALHLMFMRLTGPFEEGSTVPVLMTFKTAGEVEVHLYVGAFNAGSADAMETDNSR